MRIPIKPKVNLKKMRYGTMSVIMITAVLFSIVFLNMIFDSLELKLDLTGNKLYSLTDVSKEILRGTADRQITVYGMFDDGRNLSDAYREFVEILKEYNKFPNISVRYIDPDRNPGIIKELDPQGIKGIKRNDFVVQCGSHVKKLIVSDLLQYSEIDNATMSRQVQGNKAEQVFTSAIRTVHTGDQPVVYFTEGHAEGNLSYEYSNFREQLEINNFDTRSLNLMSVPAVPDDAVALIMLAPKSDLVQDEKLKIDDFLLTGGKLLIFIDY
ncbi:MAG: GldG family protein, partial [Oscillospiraceae bacterium]|nr:GldG family protein [Oscillospiraceae bacterium]